ncbi:hypothetical protein BKA82DRAFT_4355090 [Pisolithus tinctorius]|nr:hypothetical protein BKA82DRAFT_4355090 [Pisolithus tinctorius]
MMLSSTEPQIEHRGRRVRILFNGDFIVDSAEAKLIWENPYYPIHDFAESDMDSPLLQEFKSLQNAQVYDLVPSNRAAKGAVKVFTGKQQSHRIAQGQIFLAADARFEEDRRICVHPMGPYNLLHM